MFAPDTFIMSAFTAFSSDVHNGKIDFINSLRRLDLLPGHGYPGYDMDKLYKKNYSCLEKESGISACVHEHECWERPQRSRRDTGLVYHQGTILNGNRFVMSPETRSDLAEEYPDAKCIEMEAGGLTDIGALVVRGICDYAYGNEGRRTWQKYAAGTAAVLAREILLHIPQGADNPGSSKGAGMSDNTYRYGSIEEDRHRYLEKDRVVWENMTTSGIAVYEQIYHACPKNSHGEVLRKLSKVELFALINVYMLMCVQKTLKIFLAPGSHQQLDECWKIATSSSKETLLLGHGMTLAVLYMVHVRTFMHWKNKNAVRRLLEMPFAVPDEARNRRHFMRGFSEWVECNCDNQSCPCLWSFINQSGLCRNAVERCKAQGSRQVPSEVSDGYGIDQFNQLVKRWNDWVSNQHGY